jgi:hypothetical protein
VANLHEPWLFSPISRLHLAVPFIGLLLLAIAYATAVEDRSNFAPMTTSSIFDMLRVGWG